jgi:membrane protein DedA with SNARE-associated domain
VALPELRPGDAPHLTGWVIDVIGALGYLGLALLMVLECVFPPIPSEAILPFAGFAVGEGRLSFAGVVAACTAGSIAGNLLLYLAARRGGTALVRRHGARLGATPERLQTLERWMDRWGSATVLVGRAVPVARSAVSLPAGLARFPLVRFVVLTTLGSAVWNAALVGLGWMLDDSWHHVEERVGDAGLVVIALAVAGAVLLALRARRRRAAAS